MKKFHYVYMITNTQTNKKYIGKHSTDNLNDQYMGSGNVIKELLKNNKKDILQKTILEFCNTEEQAYEKEAYWINYYNAYYDRNFYNLSEGGYGNTSQQMKDRWESGVYDNQSFKEKQSIIMKQRMKTDTNLLEKRQKGWQNWWNSFSEEDKKEWGKKYGQNFKGKHHTQESIEQNRKNQPHILKLYCEQEPDRIFLGLKEAARWAGLKEGSCSAVSRCVYGKQKTAGKHPVTGQKCHWKEYKGDKE